MNEKIMTKIVFLLITINFVKCAVWIMGPSSDPPQPNDVARMARYIIRNSGWVSIATISTQQDIHSYPFVGLKSLSDGPPDNSTGVPYLYMTDMDVSGQDINNDNRCTIMATLAESDYCKQKSFDPQDPRCAKVIITGTMIKLNQTSPEYEFGENALYSKHPSMKWWPKDHNFYVAKIDIKKIAVLDFFGGIKNVSIDDYFKNPGDILFNNITVIDIMV